MSTAKSFDETPPKMTPPEFLAWERGQVERHEYTGGKVYLQSGASRQHNRIVSNLIRRLDEQLEDRPCDVYANDLRLWIDAAQSYYYPDVLAICGEAEWADDTFDTLVNPQLVVEVCSQSTRGVDDIIKRRHYRTVPSIREYVYIDQYAIAVERLRKLDDEHWESVLFASMDQTIELTSIECQLSVADIYRRVEFNHPEPPSS